MWQSFFRVTVQARLQQTIQNVAKVSISAHELHVQRPNCVLHCILSSQVYKALRNFKTSLCLSFTLIFIIRNTVY